MPTFSPTAAALSERSGAILGKRFKSAHGFTKDRSSNPLVTVQTVMTKTANIASNLRLVLHQFIQARAPKDSVCASRSVKRPSARRAEPCKKLARPKRQTNASNTTPKNKVRKMRVSNAKCKCESFVTGRYSANADGLRR